MKSMMMKIGPLLLCLLTGTVVVAQEPLPDSALALPNAIVASREAKLVARLQAEQAEDVAGDAPENAGRMKRRLDQLADDAANLAERTDNARLLINILTVRARALYLHLQRDPVSADAPEVVNRIRQTARWIKSVRHDEAYAIGDYWLATAELYEIRNSQQLSERDKQRQSEQVLRSFMIAHNRGSAVDAARVLLKTYQAEDRAVQPQTDTPVVVEAQPQAAEPREPVTYQLGLPRNRDGVVRVPIESRYQEGINFLRIVEPPSHEAEPQTLTVLLMLPTEAGENSDMGDPIDAAVDQDIAGRYNMLIVSPTLSDMPWYADHPDNLKLRQGTYLSRCVIPAIKRLYPAEAYRFLAVGFSKSGWGAMSMLLRSTSTFDAVAVFDAPLMLASPEQFGLDQVFTGQSHFDQYRLVKLLPGATRPLQRSKRIVLLGAEYFGDQHSRFHDLLTHLKVPHDYVQGLDQRHRWDSGWLDEAVRRLATINGAATANAGS